MANHKSMPRVFGRIGAAGIEMLLFVVGLLLTAAFLIALDGALETFR